MTRRLAHTLLAAAICITPLGLAACGTSESSSLETQTNAPKVIEGGVPQEYLDSLRGLSEADAKAKAKEDGYSVRVSMRDGTPQALTKDLRPDRVNLTIVKDKVVGAGAG